MFTENMILALIETNKTHKMIKAPTPQKKGLVRKLIMIDMFKSMRKNILFGDFNWLVRETRLPISLCRQMTEEKCR